jgi:Transposase DDE domain
MTTLGQSVIKKSEKIIAHISSKTSIYIFSLLLTTERKNYTSMARSCHKTYGEIYVKNDVVPDYIDYNEKMLISIVHKLSSKEVPGKLIIDFTMIVKAYSSQIQNTTYDRDGCLKYVMKGLSIGVAAWTNGTVTIPLTFKNWFRKKDAPETYKKKAIIAQEIITELRTIIPFDELLLDGDFASFEMLKFYTSNGFKFTVRIPRNRKITTDDGEESQLQFHSSLQLKKNEKYKTVQASIKGLSLFFTAHKRNGNNNKKEVVFIVSNVNRVPRTCVESYSIRSNVEKFFRTAKQSLGLTDCQSTDAGKQRMHITAVMNAYARLQLVKFYKGKQCVEEIIHILRRQKSTPGFNEYVDLIKTITDH